MILFVYNQTFFIIYSKDLEFSNLYVTKFLSQYFGLQHSDTQHGILFCPQAKTTWDSAHSFILKGFYIIKKINKKKLCLGHCFEKLNRQTPLSTLSEQYSCRRENLWRMVLRRLRHVFPSVRFFALYTDFFSGILPCACLKGYTPNKVHCRPLDIWLNPSKVFKLFKNTLTAPDRDC